jgi:hypothetical protein
VLDACRGKSRVLGSKIAANSVSGPSSTLCNCEVLCAAKKEPSYACEPHAGATQSPCLLEFGAALPCMRMKLEAVGWSLWCMHGGRGPREQSGDPLFATPTTADI